MTAKEPGIVAGEGLRVKFPVIILKITQTGPWRAHRLRRTGPPDLVPWRIRLSPYDTRTDPRIGCS